MKSSRNQKRGVGFFRIGTKDPDRLEMIFRVKKKGFSKELKQLVKNCTDTLYDNDVDEIDEFTTPYTETYSLRGPLQEVFIQVKDIKEYQDLGSGSIY